MDFAQPSRMLKDGVDDMLTLECIGCSSSLRSIDDSRVDSLGSLVLGGLDFDLEDFFFLNRVPRVHILILWN